MQSIKIIAQEEVKALCEMYNTYVHLTKNISAINGSMDILKDENNTVIESSTNLQKYLNDLTKIRQLVSDAMTFGSPLVWIQYKRVAYGGTEKEIKTIGDFIEHCAPEGDTCNKRYSFLNNCFRNTFGKTIKDVFSSDQSLIDLESSEYLDKLLNNDSILSEWQKHEFYRVGDVVSKWKAFEPTELG